MNERFGPRRFEELWGKISTEEQIGGYRSKKGWNHEESGD